MHNLEKKIMDYKLGESEEQVQSAPKGATRFTTSFGGVLKPLKAVIHGPPVSGRTSIAKRLCRRYGARYVSVNQMVQDTLEDLRNNIELAKERSQTKSGRASKDETLGEGEEDEELEGEGDFEGEDYVLEIAQWEEQIKDIDNLLTVGGGYLPDEYVVRLMRLFLSKEHSQSHGYVLDGYPKTLEQARELFGQTAEITKTAEVEGGKPPAPAEGEMAGEGGAIQQLGDMVGNASVNIMPDFVISFQATDEFICQRVMRIPEVDIQDTNYTEAITLRRLKSFRALNTPENTVLNFFDEAGIHPIIIDITDKDSQDMDCLLKYLYDIFGPPIPGFGLTFEEEQELRRKELEEQKLRQQAYLLEKQLAEEKLKKEYEDKMEKWAETLEQLQMEEEKIIAAESEPLRFYLMKYIFPTLAKGLSEVAKIKPDDPVDYLAEFLFKENPEGKMFDPSYTKQGEALLAKHEKIIASTDKDNYANY